jgi:cytidylate kinase
VFQGAAEERTHKENQVITHHIPRSFEQIVEDRIKRWESVPAHEKEASRVPAVAISRQAGSLGKQAAQRLADELGMDLYADQLIGLIADTTHVSERVVRTLDEKGVTFLDDMLAKLNGRYGLVSDAYFDVLAHTIATVDWHGNAVILGRGAAYMMHGPNDLRVRFIAPVEMRVKNIARDLGMSESEAQAHLIEADAERSRFVRHYFRLDYDDIRHFDLVLNGEFVNLDDSVEIIKAALKSRMRS